LNLTGNLTFNTSASDGHRIFIGSISDTGTVNVAAAVVTLGANPGPLEIVGGTLIDTLPAGGSNFVNTPFSYALGKLPSVTIDAGATLQIDSAGNGRNSPFDSFIRLFGSGQLVMGGTNIPRIVLGDSNFAGQISGSGYVGVGGFQTGAPTATAILTGDNNSAIEFQIGGGSTLQVGNGGTTGSLASGGRVVGWSGLTSPADAVLKFNRSDDVMIDRFLVGTLVLQQAGSGILTVAANNKNGDIVAFSGRVIVSSGGLSISSDNNLNGNSIALSNATTLYTTASGTYTSPVTVAGDTAFNVAAGTTTNWSGQIADGAGAGSVRMTGGGTLILSSANTYTGGTIVSSGTLRLGADNTLPAAGSVQITAGTLDLNGHAQTIGNLVNPTSFGGVLDLNGGTLTVNQTSNVGFNLPINGTGTLVFNGPGFLSLGGINSTTAAIVVNGGNLSIGNPGTLGGGNDVTINGGTFTISRRTFVLGKLSGTGGTLDIGGSALTFSSAVDSTYAGIIADGAFNPNSVQFTKAGSGTLTLSGASTATDNVAITGGTLQYGNGGASGGFGRGNIMDNAALIFNRSDSYDYIGDISGTGTVVKTGAGTLKIIGNVTVAGGTTINAGTLEVQNLSPSGLSGNIFNNSALIITPPVGMTYGGIISGSGALTANGSPGTTLALTNANTYTGGTIVSGGVFQLGAGGSLAANGAVTVNGGTFDLNGHAQKVGALSGSGGSITLGAGSLTTSSNTATSLAAAISGSGTLTKTGTGALTLIGASTYTGGTTITGGTLQIGNGGTAGSIAGNITNNAALAFNRSDAVTFASVISGNGTLAKLGAGTLSLAGTNTYTGGTAVSAGTLDVTGSIASSAVSVASGATLNGTGTVGATTIQSGGTLAAGNSIGTLTINGNLTLASGSIYNVEVSPTAADRTNITGTASLNGTVATSVAAGVYTFGQRFTILTAAGGVSGSFASLTGIPISLRGQLSYDANNAYLTLSPNALAPQLSNATGNQHNVVSAIDAAVVAGNVPPGGFVALYGLAGSALNNALDQISGQVGPNVTNAVGNSFLSFLSMTAQGGSGITGNFAPGSAYGGADAPHRAQLGSGETRVWGAVYGGHAGLSGDSVSGAAGLSSNNAGLIGGADMRVGDGLIAGVTLGLGRQWFRSGNGTGDSDDHMIGLYGRATVDAAYIAASFGYGWHQVKTVRTVTVSGTDVLQGKQNADDFGGRIEAGWRVLLDDVTSVIPYGAFAGESFESPAYAETAISGASTFALSYGAQTTALGRSELGAHLNRGFALETGTLTADLRAVWAHQLDDQPFIQASFQGLAGSAFQAAGVHPARDTALFGMDLEVHNSSGLFFGVHGEGQFGAGTTLVEGMGNFGWRW
jgi:fibronectin-binding autotransporter adhesin